MPQISFVRSFEPIQVEASSNLMQTLLKNGIPVASSCGAEGVCTKCRIQIIEGLENLSRENERELALREQHPCPEDLRVSCQTDIYGDITVDTEYW